MTDTAIPARITGEDTAPAPFKPNWLPDDAPFPELGELRDTYLRLYAQWQAEGAKYSAIRREIEDDEKQREVAMKEAMANGTSPDNIADNSNKLEADLDNANERAKAAMQAFVDHINHCIVVVLEKRPEWLAQIKQYEGDIDAEVEALQAQLRAAEARKGSFFRLDHWLDRTAAGAEFAPSHFPYGDILPPPSTDPAKQAAERQRFMDEAYEGGMGGTTKISDAAGRQREAEHVPSGGVVQTEDTTSGLGSGSTADAVAEVQRVKESGVAS